MSFTGWCSSIPVRPTWRNGFWVTTAFAVTAALFLLATPDPPRLFWFMMPRPSWPAHYNLARHLTHMSVLLPVVAIASCLLAIHGFALAASGSPGRAWFLAYLVAALAFAGAVIGASAFLVAQGWIRVTPTYSMSYHISVIPAAARTLLILYSPLLVVGVCSLYAFSSSRAGHALKCSSCGYDLRGSVEVSPRCPECGSPGRDT